ncbi:hypothetical protein ACFSJ3_14500 [Corallincola platygyrae]|uniref:Uncharacterized protein n=1 Tax=Corallincola platygyrae TaxID=1193278 RepID=A0ABW4XQ07_9GAMM
MSAHNYFSWRQAVEDAATEQGISADMLLAQDSHIYQDQYFEQQLSVDEAVEQLKSSVIPDH